MPILWVQKSKSGAKVRKKAPAGVSVKEITDFRAENQTVTGENSVIRSVPSLII